MGAERLTSNPDTSHYFPSAKLVFSLVTLISATGFFVCAFLVRHRGAIFKENDPVGYYVYARSIVHDRDIDFSNELRFFKKTGMPIGSGVGVFDTHTKRFTNQYTVGFPLLVLPFYGTFVTIASYWYPKEDLLDERFPWFLDQLIFCSGSLLLGILGMWFSYKFVSHYFSANISLLATLIFWAGSPALFYFICEPYLSHLASIFAVGAFLCFWKFELLSADVRAVLMGLMAGIIAMVRQQEIVVVIIPVAFAISSPDFSFRKIRIIRLTLLFATSFLLAFSIQMIVWKILAGSFIVYSYAESGQFWSVLSPRIFDVLFSSNHGLLIWHPIFAICLLGLLASRRLSRAVKLAFFLAFLCQLYVTSSWSMWWMGHSFGNRAFLGLTPIFILGLSAFLNEASQILRMRILLPAFTLLIIWNAVLMLGYVSEMIPHQGEFSWVEFIIQIPELPARIAEKIQNL